MHLDYLLFNEMLHPALRCQTARLLNIACNIMTQSQPVSNSFQQFFQDPSLTMSYKILQAPSGLLCPSVLWPSSSFNGHKGYRPSQT